MVLKPHQKDGSFTELTLVMDQEASWCNCAIVCNLPPPEAGFR